MSNSRSLAWDAFKLAYAYQTSRVALERLIESYPDGNAPLSALTQDEQEAFEYVMRNRVQGHYDP
ncbi:MAG: hypothetical protein A2Y38_23875 [Spirochaetes bacterium GWB1_59_5]|nr:MAG: hypothetical protein A2Y38_23875 [Spirochaetes bacterium GWB1_59_5]